MNPLIKLSTCLVVTALFFGACECSAPPTPPPPDCPAGEVTCACNAAPDDCDVDLTCSDGVCVACAVGSDGCACDAGGGCDDDFICDDQTLTCRALLDCDSAGCAEHQVCSAAVGQDAVCLAACDAGFVFDAGNNTCAPTPSCNVDDAGSIVAVCAAAGRVCDDAGPVAVCGGCDVDRIPVDDACVTNDCDGLGCAELGRACDVDVDGGESCGACDASHVVDPGNDTCVDRLTCADSPCTGATPRCTEATVGADRTCTALSNCAFNQVETAQGNCVACTACYSGTTARAGVIGVGHDDDDIARLAFGNICVCDLQPGFFQSTLDGTVTRCDADGDGWVSDLALTTADQNNGTSPLAQEQTCAIRKIDAFELRTDDGVAGNAARTDGLFNAAPAKRVTINELVQTYRLPATSVRIIGATSVALLVEPSSLDDPETFTSRYLDSSAAKRLRPYGGGVLSSANVLLAAEANPLTKACNDDNDDLNFDGVKDVDQTQEFLTPPSLRTDLAGTPLFHRLAYFIELDRGFYDSDCADDDVDCFGTYVIQEKRRAHVDGNPDGLDLALSYDDADGAFSEDPYWASCMRGREPDYVVGADNKFNTDFAHWYDDCADENGTCRTADGTVGYDGRDPQLPNDVVTPADGDPATGGRWPGMGHHSQFKCVTFANTATTQAERNPPRTVLDRASPLAALTSRPSVARTSDLLAGDVTDPAGDYTLMPCSLQSSPRSNPGINGVNPADPVMVCSAVIDSVAFDDATDVAVHPTQNYFIGLRLPSYQDPGASQYGGGCIAEHAEWGYVCGTTGTSVPVANSQRAFGKLFCTCDDFAGGAACDVGCGDERVMSQRGVDFGVISGLWMCAGPAITTNGILTAVDNSFRLVGGVVPEVIATAPLCQNPADCSSGFKLSAPAH